MTEIVIDGHAYPVCVQVVSDTLMRHQMLVGTDFLDTVEINFRAGKISICPLREPERDVEDSLEIFNIDLIDTGFIVNRVDAACVENDEQQATLQNLIENYKPDKV